MGGVKAGRSVGEALALQKAWRDLATGEEVEDFGAGPPEIGPATGLSYYNSAYYTKQALERALEALRKIALNHPCDLHDRIAALAIEDVETLRAGGTPPRRDLNY